jgi:hypothetical protein
LDLDATLVDTFGDEEIRQYLDDEDPQLMERYFEINSDSYMMWGSLRPHTKEFLATCQEVFDMVGIWSAGTYDYVHMIVDDVLEIEPSFVWTRNDCEFHYDPYLCEVIRQKPLQLLFDAMPCIDPKRTLIVDDYSSVCRQDTLQHIHLPAWRGAFAGLIKPDDALLKLGTWFQETISTAEDYKFIPHKDIFA